MEKIRALYTLEAGAGNYGGGGGHFASREKQPYHEIARRGFLPPTPQTFHPLILLLVSRTLSLSLSFTPLSSTLPLLFLFLFLSLYVVFSPPFADHRQHPTRPSRTVWHTYTQTRTALSAALIPLIPPYDLVLSAKCGRTLGTNVLL